ncbi:hypothetical protein [Marinomonas balearica]|uniref:Lipoprotein n=1 Tax=Marinomonas balearica TaxID=491947 RepID=A0A4R6MCE4_9GAMM|nr:hypothetical protein [Marinomonas balearica]TDO97919.1 hypothetical protein DFP79_1548 [Marinomonas balearica]
MLNLGQKSNLEVGFLRQCLQLCVFLSAVFLLSGCSTASNKSNFEEKRQETQVELSGKLEALWVRAHIIPDLQRGAPLVSGTDRGQQAILQQNSANLQLANGLLASLNKRVAERKLDAKLGDVITLTLVLASDKNQRQFSSAPLRIWRGDAREWELRNASGESLAMQVVWNEQGPLYIEGQHVADVSLTMPKTPFMTNVFYYGEAVVAQKALSLLLSIDVAP